VLTRRAGAILPGPLQSTVRPLPTLSIERSDCSGCRVCRAPSTATCRAVVSLPGGRPCIQRFEHAGATDGQGK
jgi:hypothetical protein